MAKLKRDTSDYTAFGHLLDELCIQRGMSFRQLAVKSGMSEKSHMSIIRACRGTSVPQRENVLAWSAALEATAEQRAKLLHYFHYAAPEEEEKEHARDEQEQG